MLHVERKIKSTITVLIKIFGFFLNTLERAINLIMNSLLNVGFFLAGLPKYACLETIMVLELFKE